MGSTTAAMACKTFPELRSLNVAELTVTILLVALLLSLCARGSPHSTYQKHSRCIYAQGDYQQYIQAIQSQFEAFQFEHVRSEACSARSPIFIRLGRLPVCLQGHRPANDFENHSALPL